MILMVFGLQALGQRLEQLQSTREALGVAAAALDRSEQEMYNRYETPAALHEWF